MKIRILTESIIGLGLGHIARSFNLALIFIKMGYKVDFFVRGNAEFTDFLNRQNNDCTASYMQNFYPLHIQWESITNPNLLECDICIIDSYHISDFTLFMRHSNILVLFDDDGRHERFLRNSLNETMTNSAGKDSTSKHLNQATKAKIFLLNPNGLYKTRFQKKKLSKIFRDNVLHQQLLQHIFSGLEYALLNPCFQNPQLQYLTRDNEFFVCLGGEDLQDKSLEIFSQLQEISCNVSIVVGANYRGKLLSSPFLIQDSQAYFNNFQNQQSNASPTHYRVFHNISQPNLALLMATSQYCIVSGGGILFEALKLCPSVFALNLASNQDEQIKLLAMQKNITEITLPLQKHIFKTNVLLQNHVVNNIGSCLEEFASCLILENLNHAFVLKQAKQAKNFTLNGFKAIDFCNINANEALRILSYRNHPFVRENMYGSSEIDEKTHFSFLQSLHNNLTTKYFLVRDLHNDIGVISLVRINLKHRHAYLGIYKNPFLEHFKDSKENDDSMQNPCSYHKPLKHNKSYGSILMTLIKYIAFEHYNLEMIYLEVIENNIRAITFYEKEGFEYLGKLKNGFRLYNQHCEKFCDILIYGIQNHTISIKESFNTANT